MIGAVSSVPFCRGSTGLGLDEADPLFFKEDRQTKQEAIGFVAENAA
jgi:hypothetical protein